MATLPKELKNKQAKMHLTTPAGHAASGGPQSQPNDGMSENRQEKEDLSMEDGKSMGRDSFLHHPQVRSKAVHQKKLVNDTAYFLHHPQIPPHGPKMPPAKPREDKRSKKE
jgi:hypothetical protein